MSGRWMVAGGAGRADRRARSTAALSALALGALGVGTVAQAWWPPTATLDCPSSRVRWVGTGLTGVARCGEGQPLPPAVAGALGLALPLNSVAEDDLARLPGIGPGVARALVSARPFRSWDAVDAVPGVGPARLATLRARTTLDP